MYSITVCSSLGNVFTVLVYRLAAGVATLDDMLFAWYDPIARK